MHGGYLSGGEGWLATRLASAFSTDDASGMAWARMMGLPCKVLFGHTIFDEPLHLPDRIGIDTGAYLTGRLTCAVLEGADVRFLATSPATPLTS